MERFVLKGNLRKTTGKASRKMLPLGIIPAVIYCKGNGNQNIEVGVQEFGHMYREIGTSSIITLDIERDGEKNVLVQALDFDPVTDEVRHIDFYEVSMKEKLTTTVPLHFVGDSKAVIDLGGSLITNKTEIEIECLPADLPSEIEVDISILEDFGKTIHGANIKLPPGVESKLDPEELVATIEAPRTEEEMAELEEPVSGEMQEKELEQEQTSEESEESAS